MLHFILFENTHFGQSGPVLVPAGLATRGTRQKAKTMKLEEVTKPMNSAANAKMQQLLLKRLLQSHKSHLLGSGAKECLQILTVLTGSLSPVECAGEVSHDYNMPGETQEVDFFNFIVCIPHWPTFNMSTEVFHNSKFTRVPPFQFDVVLPFVNYC